MKKSQEERKCLCCDNLFTVEKKSLKKFCNSSCAAKYNNSKREKKKYGECLYCGKTLSRKGKKYCSNKCQGKYKESITFKKIEDGNINFHEETFKRFLIYKFGNKCMECGWNKRNITSNLVPIQLEHIDGDSDNNNLCNLKLLCPNCHSLTSTFGRLNKNGKNSKRNLKRKDYRNK